MTHKSNAQSAMIEVLLVEDSPGDVRLTREALKDAKMHINLNVVRDGTEAMEYLRRESNYAQACRPDLILLDLGLPKLDGRQVLTRNGARSVCRLRFRLDPGAT